MTETATRDDAWAIRVDTGGTFTDCVATAPDGSVHRVKVLSTSALRGTVLEMPGPAMARVLPHWTGPDEIVVGFGMRCPGDEAIVARVVGYDSGRGILRLDRPLSGDRFAASRMPWTFELLSTEEAPVLAARLATGTPAGRALPPLRMRLATTRGTNALLERKGAAVAFFVTAGFRDIVEIGTQQRPELFTWRIEKPRPLHAFVAEVMERIASDGSVLIPIDEDSVRVAAREAMAAGVRVAAVALLHAHEDDTHERRVSEILLEEGFEHVSRSAALAPLIGHLERSVTTLVNAALSPVVSGYVERVEAALGRASLHLMTSGGGLVHPDDFRPKDSLLSGPAAGVIGAVAAARAAGYSRIITFDMGGTSTDVARFDGEIDYVWRHRVGDAELLAPAIAIESVASGGGSICEFGVAGLTVGPRSAGAHPGPACYGAGGPLTVTDCNLLLGRLDPGSFSVPVDPGAARSRLDDLISAIEAEEGTRPEPEALLAGLVDIANERMADAIRAVSLRRGYDPADYALVAFGGAGAQHGCGVAERLGVRTVIVPPDAGLLSAWGLAHARVERVAEEQVLAVLDRASGTSAEWLEALLDRLGETARRAVTLEGIDPDRVVIVRRIVNARLVGQDASLAIDVSDPAEFLADFALAYERTFGHSPPSRPVEIESARAIAAERAEGPTVSRESAAGDPPAPATPARAAPREGSAEPRDGSPDDRDGGREAPAGNPRPGREPGVGREIPRFARDQVGVDRWLTGPCLLLDPDTAILVGRGWRGRVDSSGAVILERLEPGQERAHDVVRSSSRDSVQHPSRAAPPASSPVVPPDAVREQLFANRFEGIVREMGEQLRRTAVSVNVKERLDYSCALLDPAGELVVNAPHIPVHLGAMGVCVRAVAAHVDLAPGDVVVTNHPGFGGSHLPDLTVITPVHSADGTRLGYVASRAHHAEIGGTRPGSMPPDATTLEEEGVVIPPTFLIERGVARWERITAMLADARYPSRAVDDNLADLRAQVAANHRARTLLIQLAASAGADTVAAQMAAIMSRSERSMRAALRRMPEGRYTATEFLDDGSPIAVAIEITSGSVTFDFTGTADVHPGNLNATRAIVRSAILYLSRLLVDEPLPLNEGLLRPVRVILPRCLLDPGFASAGSPVVASAESSTPPANTPPTNGETFFPASGANRDEPSMSGTVSRRDPAGLPAVVGGNTEVSQRLVDTMIRALGIAACGQGTMNNILWGTDRFGYYETIAGGEGATEGHHGASAVHTHMTNTRITDVEVLEARFPVRIDRFAVRRGSGGVGRWRGGDGVVREFTFLAPMSVSVLTQHRTAGPFGVAGGGPGLPGAQEVVRADGATVRLASVDGCEVLPGDRLRVETPGGGGWGKEAETC